MKIRFSFFLFYVLVAFYSVWLASCASVSSPTGGFKDSIPPRLLSSVPKNQTVGFKGSTVSLLFDEYFTLKNIKNDLLITPSIKGDYEYEIKKTELVLKFDEKFEENTTYTFSFGETIEDQNEKNKLKNFTLAFSTGNVIDTMQISGTVQDLLTGLPEKNCLVALYNAADTLDIDKNKPLYFTKTDTLGKYEINNISPKKYKIYALREEKKVNLIYDSNDEKIAFIAQEVELNGQQQNAIVDLKTVRYEITPFRILTARSMRQYVEVKTNKRIYDATIEFEEKKYDSLIFYKIDKDFIRFFNKNKEETDSLSFNISLKDSVGTLLDTVLRVKFTGLPPKFKTSSLAFSELPSSGKSFKAEEFNNFSITFAFDKPLKSFSPDSLAYRIDKDTIDSYFLPADLEINAQKTELLVRKKLKVKEMITLNAKEALFISIEGDTSRARPISYIVKQKEQFATVSGVVKTDFPHFTLQLLQDKTYRMEQEVKNAKTFFFDFVETGSKRFRLLIDDNGDGVWSAGDFKKRILPETVHISPLILPPLKANWDYEDNVIELLSNQ